MLKDCRLREEGKTYNQMTEMGGQETLLCHPVPASACSVKGTPQRRGELALSLQLAGHAQLPEVGRGRQGVTEQGAALKPEQSKVICSECRPPAQPHAFWGLRVFIAYFMQSITEKTAEPHQRRTSLTG